MPSRFNPETNAPSSLSLRDIIDLVRPHRVVNFHDTHIQRVICHPDGLGHEATLFVRMDEYLEYNRWQTARTHLEEISRRPPAALLGPEVVPGLDRPQIVHPAPRKALGLLARALAGNPDQTLNLIGITGTNGKTTTSQLICHILYHLEGSAAALGTLGLWKDGNCIESGHYTTPLAPDFYRSMRRLANAGVPSLALEVSSHALALDRVAGADFKFGVFTNLRRDHLDFHGTEEAYREAKGRLFRGLAPGTRAILNADDPASSLYAKETEAKVATFGIASGTADLVATAIESSPEASRFVLRWGVEEAEFRSRLIGRFQIENILAAVSVALARGHALASLVEPVSTFPPVCGRMERIPLPNGATAVVDYAHNPDGLKVLLENCRSLNPRRTLLAFGCGGDRDRGKRPMMGAIAEAGADQCFVTADNPRTESQERIFMDMRSGFKRPGKAEWIADRRQAIRSAYENSLAGDLLVVAGKGHEDYQIIGTTKEPFSDQEILRGLKS